MAGPRSGLVSGEDDLLSSSQGPAPPTMTYFLSSQPSTATGYSTAHQPANFLFPRSKDSKVTHYNNHDATGRDYPGTPHRSTHQAQSSIDGGRGHGRKLPLAVPSAGESKNASYATSPLNTPILIGTPDPTLVLSGISSRRNSWTESLLDELDLDPQSRPLSGHDGGSSRASAMVGYDAVDTQPVELGDSAVDCVSAPQLIMPRINMPSRRLFTDEGRRLGRLKILVAGDSGLGKTSLIKTIAQTCEHIVHVDPLVSGGMRELGSTNAQSPSSSSPPHKPGHEYARSGLERTTQITETFASTRPYPHWWSGLRQTHVFSAQNGLGDTILDRNLCFVDTPGYGSRSSVMDTISLVVEYVESYWQRMATNSLTDADILSMLGGDGGGQVDVVLYIVSTQLKAADIEYMRQLAPLTNVIPLIAHADQWSDEQIAIIKEQINSQLAECDIPTFSFTCSISTDRFPVAPQGPYAIQSVLDLHHGRIDDHLVMTLESLDSQFRNASELDILVGHIFSPDGAAWLRHSATKKYLWWRDTKPPFSSAIALCWPHNPDRLSSTYLNRATLCKEEGQTQIRLADWAAGLQKSLANERVRLQHLARIVDDGTRRTHTRLTSSLLSQNNTALGHADPLGLLDVVANLQRKSLLALEALGSMGIVASLAVWMVKQNNRLHVCRWLRARLVASGMAIGECRGVCARHCYTMLSLSV